MVQGQKKLMEKRGTISKQFAIIIIDLKTRLETSTPVLAMLNGIETTEDMVKQQVSALNRNCGFDGRTLRPFEQGARHVAFRMAVLQ